MDERHLSFEHDAEAGQQTGESVTDIVAACTRDEDLGRIWAAVEAVAVTYVHNAEVQTAALGDYQWQLAEAQASEVADSVLPAVEPDRIQQWLALNHCDSMVVEQSCID